MLILNGNVVEAGAPELTLLNRGFKYGDGLFELLRVYRGEILFIDEHLDALMRGMELLQFRFEAQAYRRMLRLASETLIRAKRIKDHGWLRIQIYRAGTGDERALDERPYYLIEGYSVKDDWFQSWASERIRSYTAMGVHHDLLAGIATTSRLPYVLAAMEARKQNYDHSLLFCEENVSDTTGGNLFVVKKQKLITPSLKTACRNAVIRKHFLSLCKQLKIPCAEKKFRETLLKEAEEVFLLHPLRGIVAVGQWDAYQYPLSSYSMVPFLKQCLRQYIDVIVEKPSN